MENKLRAIVATKQLEVDTNISNDEALHPIELMAKSYRL